MVVALALSFLLFLYLVIQSKHRHELKKLDKIARGNADRSLTTGELEDMIRDIVSETTAPLQNQLDELSRRLDGSEGTRLLESDELDDSRPPEQKSVGRMTRT